MAKSTLECSQCGKRHDHAGIEPSFRRPDLWLEISEDDRRASYETNDLCIITASGKKSAYVRGTLPVQVVSRAAPLHWGIWVHISRDDCQIVVEHWNDPKQAELPRMRGRLANDIPGYAPTRGLLAWLELQGISSRPIVGIAEDVDHPFATDCREGVNEEQVTRWMHTLDIF